MVTRIGLDLGYANITLSDVNAGVYREPAVALIDKNTRRIISVGNAALAESDNLSEQTLLVRPFKNGLLFDRQITQSIISNAVRSLPADERVRCVVGVPSDLLPKQEREIYAMLSEAGVDESYTVNRAVAALIGAGYSPRQSVISVNVGASVTKIPLQYVVSVNDATYTLTQGTADINDDKTGVYMTADSTPVSLGEVGVEGVLIRIDDVMAKLTLTPEVLDTYQDYLDYNSTLNQLKVTVTVSEVL